MKKPNVPSNTAKILKNVFTLSTFSSEKDPAYFLLPRSIRLGNLFYEYVSELLFSGVLWY